MVKSTGDGVVADFVAVRDAFSWARDVQDAVRAADDPAQPPLSFRIAINYGDIHTTDEDVYGHTVNVAARLQEHATPGGIAITAAALQQFPEAPPLRSTGLVGLRSMSETVSVYLWDPPGPVRIPRRPLISGIPSIAVLPFENRNGDLADEYFASEIVDDVVNSLGAL